MSQYFHTLIILMSDEPVIGLLSKIDAIIEAFDLQSNC